MPQAPQPKTINKIKAKALPPHYKSPPTPAPTPRTIPKAQIGQYIQSQLWVTVKAPPPLKALCPQHTPTKHVTFQDQQSPTPPPTPPPRPIPKPAPKPKPVVPKPPPLGYVPPKHPPPQHHHLSPVCEAIQITLSNFYSQLPPLPTVPPPSAPLTNPSNPAVHQSAQHHLRSPLHISPYFGDWWLSPRLLHNTFPCSMPSPLIPRLQ